MRFAGPTIRREQIEVELRVRRRDGVDALDEIDARAVGAGLSPAVEPCLFGVDAPRGILGVVQVAWQ